MGGVSDSGKGQKNPQESWEVDGASPGGYPNAADEVPGSLLWRKHHRVARLFETMDVVTLNAASVSLLKVIGSPIGIGFLRTWYRVMKLDGRLLRDVLLVPVAEDEDWRLF